MPRPPKTLLELMRDDTFRRDRHAELVRTQPLPEEPPEWVSDPRLWESIRFAQVAHLQYHGARDYRRSMSRDYLDAFSRGVRALHGGRVPWLLGGS